MSVWPLQRIVEVADGIIAVLNGAGEMGVSNAACVIDQGKATVIDTMTFPEMAEGMIREITRRGAKVDLVLNSHHHIDHTGGNQAFAGARIVAHPASVKIIQQIGLPATLYDHLMPRFRGRFDTLKLVVPEPALDQFTPPRGAELHVFTPAHTAADVAIWFPESRVLLAGDLSFIGVTPLAVHGLLSGWIDALDTLLKLDPLVVVPGHGPPGGKQDLIVLRTYLDTLYHLGQRVAAEELSITDALANFDAGPVAEWIEADRTALNLERGVQEAQGEISRADLSAPPPSLRQRAS